MKLCITAISSLWDPEPYRQTWAQLKPARHGGRVPDRACHFRESEIHHETDCHRVEVPPEAAADFGILYEENEM